MAIDAGYGECRASRNAFDRSLTEEEFDSIRAEVEKDMLDKGHLVKYLADEKEVCDG